MNALVADEYLVRTSDLRGFGLGARLDGFIAAAAAPTLGTSARNTLAQIRTELRFAVHLVAFQQWSLRIVDADPDHPVRAERDLVRHLYASSAGRLLLADQRTWQSRLPATRCAGSHRRLSPISPHSTSNSRPCGSGSSPCRLINSKRDWPARPCRFTTPPAMPLRHCA